MALQVTQTMMQYRCFCWYYHYYAFHKGEQNFIKIL